VKRLSPYPVREKVTDDVDWEKIPEKKWEMNFRPLRDHQNAISVLNAFFPFLFGNSETLFLLLFAAAVPFVLAWNKPQLETGIELYGTLVLLLLISNLGLLFLGGYRDEFYSPKPQPRGVLENPIKLQLRCDASPTIQPIFWQCF